MWISQVIGKRNVKVEGWDSNRLPFGKWLPRKGTWLFLFNSSDRVKSLSEGLPRYNFLNLANKIAFRRARLLGKISFLPNTPMEHLQKFSSNSRDTETELIRAEAGIAPSCLYFHQAENRLAHKAGSCWISAPVLNASQPFHNQGFHQYSGRMYKNNLGPFSGRLTGFWASPEFKPTQLHLCKVEWGLRCL